MALGPELIAGFTCAPAPAAGSLGWRCNGGKTGAGVVVINLVEPVNVAKDLILVSVDGTNPNGSITYVVSGGGLVVTVNTANNANASTDAGFSFAAYRVSPYAQ